MKRNVSRDSEASDKKQAHESLSFSKSIRRREFLVNFDACCVDIDAILDSQERRNAVNIIRVHLLNFWHFMTFFGAFFLCRTSTGLDSHSRPHISGTDKIFSPFFFSSVELSTAANVIMLTSFYLIFIFKVIKSRRKFSGVENAENASPFRNLLALDFKSEKKFAF